jgi:hypothetical protein
MMDRPIPAIPKPMITQQRRVNHAEGIKKSKVKGTKYKSTMKMVLNTILAFACMEIFLSSKYALTRLVSVLLKSTYAWFEKLTLLN